MRVLFIITAYTPLALLILSAANGQGVSSGGSLLGVLLLSSASLIAAAIVTPKPARTGSYYHYAYVTYEVLSEGPRDFSSLVDEVVSRNPSDDVAMKHVRQTIVQMLGDHTLTISNGLVELAHGTPAKATPDSEGEA